MLALLMWIVFIYCIIACLGIVRMIAEDKEEKLDRSLYAKALWFHLGVAFVVSVIYYNI